MPKRKMPQRPRGCTYVATRGTKRLATRLARGLHRDGFKTRVTKTYGGARLAYGIFSCGRRKR